MAYVFEIGKTYKFETKAPALLGTFINNARLVNIMDYNSAITYDNIDIKYRNIYPLLPGGTPTNPESCIYYRFKSESGENIVLADQWIQESTIEIVEHIVFQVTFTDASVQDMTKVRNVLNSVGGLTYVLKQL